MSQSTMHVGHFFHIGRTSAISPTSLFLDGIVKLGENREKYILCYHSRLTRFPLLSTISLFYLLLKLRVKNLKKKKKPYSSLSLQKLPKRKNPTYE